MDSLSITDEQLNELNADWELVEMVLKELPSNIFFKDTQCRYLFATHYWNHIEHDDSEDWSIRGKTDLEIRKDRANALRAYEEDKKILETGVGCQYTIEVCLEGVTEYLEIIKNPVRNTDGTIIGIIGLINIVTDRVNLQKQLEAYAQTDIMTGLYNRRYLEQWCDRELKEQFLPVSVISADCDGLKKANDTYGHFVGDEMIRSSAQLFKAQLPDNAVIFRMGGDEFLIILPNADATQASDYVSQLRAATEKIHIKSVPLSISYGNATMDSIEIDLMDIIKRADGLMYEEKEHKKR